MSVILEYKEINKSFGAKQILKDINLQIESNKIVGLLGKNGSGKSTLFKSILGLIKIKSGQILVDGVDINKLKEKERAKYIAYVSQNIMLPPLTVYEIVSMGRMPYYNFISNKSDKDVIEEILKKLNIFDLKDKIATELSGGERQLVSIARALAQKSRVIVFDEPTSNLDIKNEVFFKKTIKELVKTENISILISVHDLTNAYDLGDSYVFVKEGKAIVKGNKEIFTEDNIYNTFNQKVKIKEIDGSIFVKYKE